MPNTEASTKSGLRRPHGPVPTSLTASTILHLADPLLSLLLTAAYVFKTFQGNQSLLR